MPWTLSVSRRVRALPRAGRAAEAAAEAEARLLALCRQLVGEAARDAWARPALPGGGGGGGGGGGPAPLAPEGYSWDQARAPCPI
jgi:hypothetical protein